MLTTGKILNRIPKTHDMYYVYILGSKTVRPAKALMNIFCFAGDTVLIYMDKTYNMGFIIGTLHSPVLKKLKYQIPTIVETHSPFFTTYSTLYSDLASIISVDKLRNCYKVSLSTSGFPLLFTIDTKSHNSIFNYIITSDKKIFLSTRNLNIAMPILGPNEGNTASLLLDCSLIIPSKTNLIEQNFIVVCIEPMTVNFNYQKLINKMNEIPATNVQMPNIGIILPPNNDAIQYALNTMVIPAIKSLARDLNEIGIELSNPIKVKHIANISLSGQITMLYEDGRVKIL